MVAGGREVQGEQDASDRPRGESRDPCLARTRSDEDGEAERRERAGDPRRLGAHFFTRTAVRCGTLSCRMTST